MSKSLGYLEGSEGQDELRFLPQGRLADHEQRDGIDGEADRQAPQGVEAVMQLRIDSLSDDEPMAQFWQQRPDRMTGQRSCKKR